MSTELALTWLDNFVPPKDASEALERSLEYAEFEENWCTGRLFEVRDGTQYDPVTSEYVLGEGREVCTNVRACAMGIIVIACLDGPAVKKFFDSRYDFEEEQVLTRNTVAKQATKFLARALNTGFPKSGEGSGFADAIGAVEQTNDNGVRKLGRKIHHQNIVRGFRDALAMAREDAAKHAD